MPREANQSSSWLVSNGPAGAVFVATCQPRPALLIPANAVDRSSARHARSIVDEFDFPAALGVRPDGSQVFVTGASFGSTGYDYATVAYDGTNGAELWVRRSDPATYGDLATSLGVSPDGSAVFVTGTSFGSTGRLDYLTIAYSVE